MTRKKTEVSRRVSVKRQDGHSIASGAAKTAVPFYYRACLSSEPVSRKFVASLKIAEIQVNIFTQVERMTVGATLIQRNCCLNAVADVINRYQAQN